MSALPPRYSMRLWDVGTGWQIVGEPDSSLGAGVSLVAALQDDSDGAVRDYVVNLQLEDTYMVQEFVKALATAVFQHDGFSAMVDQRWQVGPRPSPRKDGTDRDQEMYEVGGVEFRSGRIANLAPGQAVLTLDSPLQAVRGDANTGSGSWTSLTSRQAQWHDADGRELDLDVVNLVMRDGREVLKVVLTAANQMGLAQHLELLSGRDAKAIASRNWMLPNGMSWTVMVSPGRDPAEQLGIDYLRVPIDGGPRIWLRGEPHVALVGNAVDLTFDAVVESNTEAEQRKVCLQLQPLAARDFLAALVEAINRSKPERRAVLCDWTDAGVRAGEQRAVGSGAGAIELLRVQLVDYLTTCEVVQQGGGGGWISIDVCYALPGPLYELNLVLVDAEHARAVADQVLKAFGQPSLVSAESLSGGTTVRNDVHPDATTGEPAIIEDVVLTMLDLADAVGENESLAGYLRHRLEVMQYELGIRFRDSFIGSFVSFAEGHLSSGVRGSPFRVIDLSGALEVPQEIGDATNATAREQSHLEGELSDLRARLRELRARWLHDVLTAVYPHMTERSVTEPDLQRRGLPQRPAVHVDDPSSDMW